MSMEQNKAAPRRKLWLRLLLGASLALNLLVVGLAIGAALRFGGPEGARRPPTVLGATLYRELPREDRRAIREAMRGAALDRGPDRKTAARQVADLVRATPFDATAVEMLFSQQAARRDEWQTLANAVLIEHLGRMSEAERAAYADRIEEALSRTRRHNRRHNEKRD
ncbi:periplasmic heavy metal sensor [Sedimentitalea todarodis]|uniref:Periplasmic heavy metal sensor n=1 Tax=Sedimentitalea todarodis TaxID=1631240 RepID=A0ABU3VLS6_9RHOB|nr:periplasmic heavy metal sensor [Sedimentitalea todarodis]MDU9007144.1 periplasmic heavy metal sensor [Sedimentitalea todarodis]